LVSKFEFPGHNLGRGQVELRQLHNFIAVLQTRSISKAAAAIHIAQPALSRQIKQLEESLGVQLLYRDGRGVAPTQVGARFAEQLAPMLQQLEQCLADVVATRGIPTDDVTLGTTFAVGSPLIAQLISQYRDLYPHATLRVVEGFSYHVVEWLQTGRIDMGIVYHPDYYPRFDGRTLSNQALHLIGRKDDKVRPPATIDFGEAIKKPLIMPVRPNSISALVEEAAKSRKLPINLKLEVDSISTIKQLLKGGDGYTILQQTSVHEDIEQGTLFAARIENPRISRPFRLCFPQRGIVTLSSRKLIELIESEVKRFVRDGRWAPSVK
jgi:LysR family nitrogen assimilation transcriptional regulator